MSEQYRGKQNDRVYKGEEIDVTFNLKRCVHVAACLKGMPVVFDKEKRPWIQADNGEAADLAAVISTCPSGALHYNLKNGPQEEAPEDNIIYVHTRGFYRISGELEVTGATVDIPDETRATLCRCGASSQKPFCDNSHREINFRAPSPEPKERKTDLEAGGPLRIHFYENGPIEIEGNFEIRSQRGDTLFQGENKKTWLCRCGASNAKPFCDQAHKSIGFEAP